MTAASFNLIRENRELSVSVIDEFTTRISITDPEGIHSITLPNKDFRLLQDVMAALVQPRIINGSD